jgi:putative oxidoreductase
VFVGVAFFGHGTQKLFGWWGGYGPQGTGGFFTSLGYRNGVLMAVLAGLAEAGGGTLLALGLLTPLACALIALVMLNAIFAVTLKRAFMAGSELELAYLVTAISLAAIGPGRFSLDRAIGWDDDLSGLWCGVGAFVAAAAVSFVTLTFLHTKPPPQPTAQAE